MKLSTRLVLLILGCLLPILTAQIYSQINLYGERHEQLGGLVLRQAELANADMASIVDGAHQLGTLIDQFSAVRTERCSDQLTKLRQSLTQYRFLLLCSPVDGSLQCASDGAPAAGAYPPWIAHLLTTPDLAVGQLVSDPAENSRFLPIAVALPGLGASDQPRVLIAGLNTDWLVKHLETAHADRAPRMARATLIIADRDGNVLGRVPDSAD